MKGVKGESAKNHQKLTLLVIESGFSARMYTTKMGYPFNRFQEIQEMLPVADHNKVLPGYGPEISAGE